MLQSIKQLYGEKLGASDGLIGHVKDFYFDDNSWVVRYVVADTGSWLTGRQVLISPHSLERKEPSGKVLGVHLTRKQVENSPSIDEHKPVSRQYEEDYYRYYGWPNYWQGELMWGFSDIPLMVLPATPLPSESQSASKSASKRADAHLRSTKAVSGYLLEASDGTIGQVSDFLIETHNWAIGQFVIKIGHRFSGKEVQIPVGSIDRISYEASTVFTRLTKTAVEESPQFHPAMAGVLA